MAERTRSTATPATRRAKPPQASATPPQRRAPSALPEFDHTQPVDAQVRWVIEELGRRATRHTLDGMARYGIPADNALGVSMADLQTLAKRIGRHHALALALWDTGVYEARMLCAFVDEPARVSATQMDRWCRDFDNWAICDTLCFKLFDQTPLAWAKVAAWSGKRDEFAKRAGFALLASLAGHDKTASDDRFIEGLALVERAAGDERNFVKKGVSWALRRIGSRSSARLRSAAVELAQRLAASDDPTERWIGKDALRDFTKVAARRQTLERSIR